jgi:hypothetical protein
MTSVQSDAGVLAGDERMLIDGELQYTGSGATFDVIHSATEQVAGQATDGTVEDVARAVGAARRAFDETDWSRDVEFRFHCLTQLHDALERNKEHRGAQTRAAHPVVGQRVRPDRCRGDRHPGGRLQRRRLERQRRRRRPVGGRARGHDHVHGIHRGRVGRSWPRARPR